MSGESRSRNKGFKTARFTLSEGGYEAATRRLRAAWEFPGLVADAK